MSQSDQNIAAQLAGLQATVEQYMQNQDKVNTHLAKLCEDHAQTIYGTPASDGMRVRMDRLEQSENRRTVISGAALAAGIGLIIERVFSFLSGIPPHH